MKQKQAKNIFIVDGELKVCEIVKYAIKESDFKIICFDDPIECLEQLRSRKKCHLLINHLKMPEKDGIELLKDIRHIAPWIPVVIITAYGDIATAVEAMKAGAVDFIQKPLDKRIFAKKIRTILNNYPVHHLNAGSALTPKEAIVLRLIIDGKSNRGIADILQNSIRTIEVHRSHIMQKIGANNINEFFKHLALMGFLDNK